MRSRTASLRRAKSGHMLFYIFAALWLMLCLPFYALAEVSLDASYDALLANPNDDAANLAYSRAQAAAGDHEAAVPPLERLLMKYPDALSVRLELGQRYASLGATDVALRHFTKVVEHPKADASLKAQAQSAIETLTYEGGQ